MSEKKRVLVCGGRDFNDKSFLFEVLDRVHESLVIATLIHGNARGADTLADFWAVSRDIPRQPFPADWNRYGLRAGPIRNHRMLVEGLPDLVVAFPGGSGTANMIAQAKRAHVPCIQIFGGTPP